MGYVVRNGLLVPKRQVVQRKRAHVRVPHANIILRRPFFPIVRPLVGAVAISATGTKNIGGSSVTTTGNITPITVGASDTALIVFAEASLAGTGTNSSAFTATWNSVAMTNLVEKTSLNTNNAGGAAILGLRNPDSGLKNLNVSWTGTGFPTVYCISVTGSDTTSDANAFPTAHRTSSNGTTNTAATTSIAVTSAGGNMAVGFHTATGLTAGSENQTLIGNDVTSSGMDSSSQRAAGAASVTFSITTGPNSDWMWTGIDIAAAAGGVPYQPYFQQMLAA